MIKKVKTEKLRPGMFVDRFGSDWFHHPFLLNHMRIKNRHEIDRMIDWGVEYVFIDTDRGFDVEDEEGGIDHEPGEGPAAEIDFVKLDEPTVPPVFGRIPFREEIVEAKVIRTKSRMVIHRLLNNVRGGRSVNVAEAKDLVADMDKSVCRNKDALMLLMRMRSKDEYTFMHSVSVGAMLLAFCRSMGIDGETARIVGLGGVLHDVGKMAVPLDILNKPSALTDSEYSIMKLHSLYCREILSKINHLPEIAAIIARQHHERFDGTGYPFNLQGEEIAPAAQMAAIADVFDAITADRCYHQGMDQVQALCKIYGWRDSHFDSNLVQHFIRCVGIYPPGTVVRLASGRIGVAVSNTDNLLKPVVRVVYDTALDWAITAVDIDLSKEDPVHGDRIVGYELPQRWRIDPLKVLEISGKLF